MIINNVEIDFDFFDADCLELYDKEAKVLKEQVAELDKQELEAYEKIRMMCHLQFDFLDKVFGEGISNKLFGTKCSLRDTIKVVEQITQERDLQAQEVEKFTSKYSTSRAERRK